MAGHVCTECGLDILACGEKIRQGDGECCDKCFTGDTHGLLEPAPDAIEQLIDRISKVEANLLAQMTILNTELMKAVGVAGQAVGELRQRIDGLEERLEHFDHDQAVVDYGILDRAEGELEDRVDILERCIADMERIFKLRRKTT